MKIDFNHLRRKLGEHYNSFIECLNSLESLSKQGYENLEFEKHILRNKLDCLRSDIVGILCCYEEGNPDCIAIDIDILPAFEENNED